MFIALVLIVFVVLAFMHWRNRPPQSSRNTTVVLHDGVPVVCPATMVFHNPSDWGEFHDAMNRIYEEHPDHVVVDLSQTKAGTGKYLYGTMVEAIGHCQEGELESIAVVRPPGKTQRGFFYKDFLDIVENFRDQIFLTDTLDEALVLLAD
jgi:hypothetical protein